jgi:hypothetical protein
MADSGFKGKSMKAVAFDVAEGLITVNPLFLKKFDNEMVKSLNEHLSKTMTTVRNEQVPANDPPSMRSRSLKLQRLNNALIILKNIAREKRIPL